MLSKSSVNELTISNAAFAVQNLLKKSVQKAGSNVLTAIDYLDDGSPIKLKVTIDPERGTANFDFTGTGSELNGNLNAPISVVHSAIIYCMRAMVGEDIPLNAGCIVPLDSESGHMLARSQN